MIKKGSLVFTFSSLLLFSLTGIAYAQKTTISCPDSNLSSGSVCINRGTVINITYQNGSFQNKEVSSLPPENTPPQESQIRLERQFTSPEEAKKRDSQITLEPQFTSP